MLSRLAVLAIASVAWADPLGPAAQKASNMIEEGARDKNELTRASVARALALMPEDRRAVDLVETALLDRSEKVRQAAALSLGDMLSTDSVPHLIKALHDPDIAVVMAAARSLDMLRNAAAYELYYAVLAGQRKSGSSLRSAGATQMKRLRDPKNAAKLVVPFVPIVGNGYTAMSKARKKDDSPARAMAAAALAHDPDPRSAEALTISAYDRHPAVRAASIAALARRDDPVMLNDIVPALDDKDREVQFIAAAAILHLNAVAGALQRDIDPPPR